MASHGWQFAGAAAILLAAGAGLWVMRSSAHLAPGEAPKPTIWLNDVPGVVGVTASGDVVGIQGLTNSDRLLIWTALSSGRLPQGPAPLELDAESSGNDGKTFSVVSPVGTRVYTDRPMFHWTVMTGAESYKVVVFDAELNEVAESGKVAGTEWQLEQPLPRRRFLSWQVAAEGSGRRKTVPRPHEPAAVFEIISLNAARAIDSARAGEHPSHLLVALLYAREGLRDGAEEEVGKLAALNPNSPLVESLAQSARR